jgi:hypothetical protein
MSSTQFLRSTGATFAVTLRAAESAASDDAAAVLAGDRARSRTLPMEG